MDDSRAEDSTTEDGSTMTGGESAATGNSSTLVEDASTASGVLAPVAILLTFAVGAAVSPTYDWPTDPFSVLGAQGEPTAGWFNAGLMAGGLLGLAFAARLWNARSAPVGGLYALVALSFVGAGLFSIESGLHELFGAGAFLGIWLLLWVAAASEWRDGSRRAAILSFALGTAAVAVWLPYDFDVEWAKLGHGFAELVAVLALAAWSTRVAIRLRTAARDGQDASGGRSASGSTARSRDSE